MTRGPCREQRRHRNHAVRREEKHQSLARQSQRSGDLERLLARLSSCHPFGGRLIPQCWRILAFRQKRQQPGTRWVKSDQATPLIVEQPLHWDLLRCSANSINLASDREYNVDLRLEPVLARPARKELDVGATIEPQSGRQCLLEHQAAVDTDHLACNIGCKL